MARGRKKEINYAQEIEMMEHKIAYHQNALNLLETKINELRAKKNEEEIKMLQAFLVQNNLSANDILQKLSIA